MPSEKTEFKGHSGDTLAARLDRPAGRHRATALFAHCFTCSKDIAAARRIAQRLSALGFAVLRFDFTGLGHSGGEFGNTHFTSNVEDLVLAARHLEAMGMPPDLLIGHSLGGAAVLAAAGQVPHARAVVTIGAPSDPAHVLHNFGTRLEEIERDGAAEVELAGRSFRIGRDFVEQARSADLKGAIGTLDKALLVLHAPRDETVGIENAAEIFMAAKHPKSFITLDGADHLLSRAEDAEYAGEVIASWARRYLHLNHEAKPIGAPEGVVRVREADPAGFLQDISAGPRHAMTADEPATYGGTDQGPTPYQLVAAGLGACTSMTIRMYARRKGWSLDSVSVDVSHQKIHASDSKNCENPDGKIDEFLRVIRLEGALDAAQRARLLEIADRCPVHRTLEASARIETRSAERATA